jgi:hypothetical protein
MPVEHGFDWTMGLQLVLALALGLLVGLERERVRSETKKLFLGGVRTYPIISLFGFACAWLHMAGVAWILAAGLLAVLVLAAVGYAGKIREGRLGATSEVAALLTYVVGALVLLADIRLAVALGVINTILLSEKAAMESLVVRLDKVEFLAILRFLLVTFIIYPVVPDQDFTAFHLNPARIWRMVILVSSIGFVGYFLIKKFGSRVGLWLSGLMGGIVSSTAVSIKPWPGSSLPWRCWACCWRPARRGVAPPSRPCRHPLHRRRCKIRLSFAPPSCLRRSSWH